jgi:tetratricopeptide (TPR) repeat protein
MLLEKLHQRQNAMGEAVYDLVKFYSAVGQPQKASAYYELLIQPTSDLEERALQYLEKGRLMEQQGKYQQAISFYARALPLEPQDLGIWYFINNNLGYSLNQCEEYERAEEYCRAAIRIAPARHNAYKNLALALEGMGDYVEAIDGYVKAVERMPRDFRALGHLEDLLNRHPYLLVEDPEVADVVVRCQEMVSEARDSRVE